MNSNVSDIQIRSATSNDVEVLGEYGAQLIALHHNWDPQRFISSSSKTPAAYSKYFRSLLGRSDVVLLTAAAADKIVGYTYGAIEGFDYMSLRGPAGVIHDIFVEPGSRRRGVGRMLLDATAADLAERGARQLVLSTAYQNDAGRRLFASAGYRPTMIEMTLQLAREPGSDGAM